MLSTISTEASSFSRDSLHGYQLKAVDFIKSRGSCALWVDMGLGKTVATLTAIADLMDTFTVGRVLIIAPLRVAQHTWPEEIVRWSHVRHLSYAVLCGNHKQRISALQRDVDMHIINREQVAWLVDTLGKNWHYDMVVIDEASSFKSSKTKRFKALKKTLPHIDRLIELTGTPTSNGLLDVWSQLYLVDCGERLGKTFSGFRWKYFVSDYTGYNWHPTQGSETAIYEKLQDVCMTLSAKDYLNMPARIDNTILVELSASETDNYRALERDFILALEDSTIEAFSAAALSNKLLQFCNGAVYTDDSGSWTTLHQHKLNALADIVDEAAGQPVLVAYNFRSDRARIKAAFKQAVAVDELDAISRWNAGKIPILLAHPASAGHGLNLQSGGHIIVWFGLNWSLELYQQFNARLHRQGQTKPVIIHHLVVNNSVDTTVMESLRNKHTTQKALLDALKSDIGGRLKQ